MSKRSTADILTGLTVGISLFIVIMFSLKSANLTALSETNTYRITARFDNIGSLKIRATVRASGIAIGRVKSISLDPKSFQGVVEMAISNKYLFPKDSSAKIQTTGLLGDQYIALEAGVDTLTLKSGDSISMTRPAVRIEQIIEQFLLDKRTPP